MYLDFSSVFLNFLFRLKESAKTETKREKKKPSTSENVLVGTMDISFATVQRYSNHVY